MLARLTFLSALFLALPVRAELVAESVHYQAGDTALIGELYYDSAIEGPRPGVLVVHEWWGLNEHAKSKAKALAQAGYVGFALDMYGGGKTTEHATQASAWSASVTKNFNVAKQRFSAAYDLLRAHSKTRPEQIAAIGYCFGGNVVLRMAMAGAPLKGVVSFHGSLPDLAPAPGSVGARILVLHGGSDPFVKPEQISRFKRNLTRAEADWDFVVYDDAKHSFTNPQAEKSGMAGLAYDAAADRASWQAMLKLFDEIFAGHTPQTPPQAAREGRSVRTQDAGQDYRSPD